MHRRYRIFAIAAVLALIADQATKAWARSTLTLGHKIEFLGSFWGWDLSFNRGSAFGLFNTQTWGRWLLTLIALAAGVAIPYYVSKERDDYTWGHVAFGMLWAGAIGNVIDRIWFGVVTDFIAWDVEAWNFRWPRFNVADAALVAGIAILFLGLGKKKA